MIDLEQFIKRPDSFDMRISMVNGNPVVLYRDCFLDKPGVEMVFHNTPVVTVKVDGKDVSDIEAPFGRLADGSPRFQPDEENY